MTSTIILQVPHLGNESSIKLIQQPAEKYSGNGAQSLINGIKGSNEKYGDSEWLGFDGDNLKAEIVSPEPIETLSFRMFKGEGQWIYLPKSIKVFDLKTDDLITNIDAIQSDNKVLDLDARLNTPTKEIKLVFENFGVIPAGSQGSGHKAWLFVDEITIK